jgi:hypothetical protein
LFYKPTYNSDITIVNGDDFMVYKPTFTSLGGPILYQNHPGNKNPSASLEAHQEVLRTSPDFLYQVTWAVLVVLVQTFGAA